MKRLNDWFEIDEQEYLMYLLKGYDIQYSNSIVLWRLDGKYHREDGPALLWKDGAKEWWVNDNLHREDGPARVGPDGDRRKNWHLNNIEYSESEFNEAIKELKLIQKDH